MKLLVYTLRGIVSYDGTEVMKLIENPSNEDVVRLKIEALSLFEQGEIINERFYAIYLRSLLWSLVDNNKEFVIDIASKVLNKDYVLNKDPWVVMLEDLDELEPIALFFKDHTDYGDRFFQEKLLYILSETEIEIGDKILLFLNSEYEILSSAALTAIDDQNLKKYLADLFDFFKKSEDSDLLLKSAIILMDWNSTLSIPIIRKKVIELNQINANYYSEVIEELKELL
jgi:hypothetical protein